MSDKLSRLRAIREQLINDNGCSTDEATAIIGDLLGRSRFTVYRWLNASQKDPIPDNLLELLDLKSRPPRQS